MRTPLWVSRALMATALMACLSACGTPVLHRSRYIYNTAITVKTPKVTNIDPVTGTGYGNHLYDQMVYQTLTSLSPEGQPTPGLAKSWTHRLHDTEWTFQLNPFAKWWNGRPVTAQDVAWSLDFYQNPQSGFVHTPELSNIKTITSLSRTTVQIVLWHPDPGFAGNLGSPRGGLWILPAFALHRLPVSRVRSANYLTHLKDAVGTGPFRPYDLTSHGIKWIAAPHFYLGTPQTKYLHWTWSTALKSGLKEGTLDLAWTPSRVKNPEGYHESTRVAASEWVLTTSSRNLGLDRQELQRIASLATNGGALPGIPAYNAIWPRTAKAQTLPSAKRPSLTHLLTDTGFHLSRGMWVDVAGDKLSLTLRTPPTSYGKVLARKLVENWRQEGLSVTMVSSSYADHANLSLGMIPAYPTPEPLPPGTIPLVWPHQFWYMRPRITKGIPNVWQPFYKVEAWRVQSHPH